MSDFCCCDVVDKIESIEQKLQFDENVFLPDMLLGVTAVWQTYIRLKCCNSRSCCLED